MKTPHTLALHAKEMLISMNKINKIALILISNESDDAMPCPGK